jgi:MFS family permease
MNTAQDICDTTKPLSKADPHSLRNSLSFFKAISIYTIVSLFLFFEMALQVSPSVMATQLMHDLDMTAFGLGIMSGVYFYTYTAMQIPSGFLLDRFSPRIIISLALLTCSIGAMLFSFIDNIFWGSLARLLMGCGSAFGFVSVLVVTADLFESKYFATLSGITQTVVGLGAMSGQIPIGILISHIGWRHTMLVLSAIGLTLAVLVWCFVKYKSHKQQQGYANSNVKADLKKVMSNPQTWYIALYACLLWAPIAGFASLWGVPFLTSVDHFSVTQAAIMCACMWSGLAVASPLLGMVSTALNRRVLPLAFVALVGAVAFTLIIEFSFSLWVVGILMFLAGAACSGQSLSYVVVKENNPIAIKGTAIAFNNMAGVVSGAIFQPLIGKLISTGAMAGVVIYNANDFKHGLSILVCAYVLAFLIAVFFVKESIFKNTQNLADISE